MNKFNKTQKDLVELAERSYEAGIRGRMLSGLVCEDLLMKELRGEFRKLNFNRGTIKYGDGSFSPQLDIIVYKGEPEFSRCDIVVVSSSEVSAVIEVKKKLISEKNLKEIREKITKTKKELKEKNGRNIPMFLVAFRDYTRNYKNSLKGKSNEYCFFMVNSRHHFYPWNEKMWPDEIFIRSSYSGEFERLIKELS